MIDFLQDFTCGSISGVANVLSGYILDTLKVRIQMDPQLTMRKAFVQIIQKEGFMQLFSGIYYPLITIPLVNAVLFSSYEFYKVIRQKNQLTLLDGFQNGAFAGLVVTFVVTPVELIKCVMQNDSKLKYASSRVCLNEIIKNQGIRGLFRGSFSTAARQIPSYSVQFATYEWMKSLFITENHPHLSLFQAFLVGPIAAFNSWVVSYPQDLIKTKIQVALPGTYKPHRLFTDGGFIDCARQIYAERGVQGFLIGITPCLLRGAIGDGIGLVVYQKCQQLFSRPHLL